VKLDLHFVIPDDRIAQLGPMTLSAEIDDFSIEPETYVKGGDHHYVREIPARILKTNVIPVIFSFDKASDLTGNDARELGAIVTSISLTKN
jgi:hypothetical protein